MTKDYLPANAINALLIQQLTQETKPMAFRTSKSTAAKSESNADQPKAYISAWEGDGDAKHVLGGYIKLTPALLEELALRVANDEVGEYGIELSFRIYENTKGNVPFGGNAIIKESK